MKKTITFFSTRAAMMLLSVMMLTMTAQTAWADDPNGECGKTVDDEVYWYVESENTLIISGNGDMADYSDQGGQPWSSYCNNITTIVIKDFVTSIGNYAFYGCTNVANVYVLLDEDDPTLGNNAFNDISGSFYLNGDAYSNNAGWANLTKTIIIYGVYFISGNTSNGNPVYSYNGIDYYEKGAKLTLDSGTNYVVMDESGDDVTASVLNGSTLTVPAYDIIVMAISGNCGASGNNGNNVTWAYDSNSKVLTISGTGAMADYSNDTEQPWCGYHNDIEKIIIGDDVTHIGDYAFACFYNGNQPLSVTIPTSVTTIGANAFLNCGDLTSITIPASVTSIGVDAFDGCIELTSITLEEGLTTIGNCAFNNCCSLTSITIPSTVENIGELAFVNCSSLTSVTILAKSLTTHGTDPFYLTAAGLEIYVPATSVDTYKSYWPDYANNFKGLYTVTLSSLPDGVTGVASANLAVAGETVTLSFTGVPAGKVPDFSITYDFYGNDCDVYEIKDNGDGTFSFPMPDGNVTVNCGSDLKDDIKEFTATVPDQMTNNSLILYKFEAANNNPTGNVIGETVIKGNTKLVQGTDYEFGRVTYANGDPGDPDTVGDECLVEIKGRGNYGGSLYAPFTIVNPSGNGTWGDNGELTWNFANGTLSITLTNPENGNKSMKEPGKNASYPWIQYAGYIAEITIGEGITSIGKEAFGGAVYQESTYGDLETITLPDELTTIGDRAFYYSKKLTLTIPASVTTIGTEAFVNVACVTASLSDTGDNTTLISRLADAQSANVTLSGRTLYKDGAWNTLCLPFNLDDFTDTPLVDATVMELGNSDACHTGFDAGTGTLSLDFVAANKIEAGHAYIVKWANGDNIENPVFSGVTIVNEDPAGQCVLSADKNVRFQGAYSPTAIAVGDKSSLFLGVDADKKSMLYYPDATNYTLFSGLNPAADNSHYYLGAFRAYFHVDLTGGQQARQFVLNFGDDAVETGIIAQPTVNTQLSTVNWYTLDGRRLSDKPAKKGVYIHDGRKVVIK